MLEDDFFRANHLTSEDQAAVRRYRHYVGVAKEFTKPLSVRHGEYLSSPTNREVDSFSRVPATRRVRTSPSSRDSGAHAMANQSLIEEEFDNVVSGKLFEPEEPLLVTPGPVAATNADPIMCAMNCGREVWGDQTGLSKFCSKSCRKMFLELNYESAALSTALSSRDPPSPKDPLPCAMGCGGVYLVTGAFSPCCSRACSNEYDGTKQTHKDTPPTIGRWPFPSNVVGSSAGMIHYVRHIREARQLWW